MIDRKLKRTLGQMAKGVQVVAATNGETVRAYTSHWVCQVSFDQPIIMASVSPKHDTYPLIVGAGWFTVSILGGDQITEGQYFSYPGRKFNYVASELIAFTQAGEPYVPNSLGWLRCETFDRIERFDHHLFFARVVEVHEGRLGEDPLIYSARHGWRIACSPARQKGRSVRDELLARVEAQETTTEDAAG